MTAALLEPIRQALLSGDLPAADQALVDSLYSSEAITYWHTVTRLAAVPQSIHHTLSFVNEFRFSNEETTAHVNLESRVLTLGTSFFLDTLHDFGDLLFILLHERGHILISLVYGSMMPRFSNHKFSNMWEDVYINNTILFLMNSTLCARVYKESDSFFGPLLRQNFPRWVANNQGWLRFNLSRPSFSLLRRSALTSEFFTQVLAYTDWMDIGLEVEKALGFESPPEFGSGNLLSDFSGNEASTRDEVRPFSPSSPPSLASLRSSSRSSVGGTEVPGVLVPSPLALSPLLLQVLHSFSSKDCPPEFAALRHETNLSSELELTIQESLIGDVLALKQGDAFYEGRSASFHRLHRRDVSLLAAGHDLTLWTIDLPIAKTALKLYVDVSGSMWSFLRVMQMIHEHLSSWVDRHYQFSTEVVAVDPDRDRGLIFSTGATSYQVVADHILQEGYQEVIVLTDNTDTIAPLTLQKLKSQLQVLYLIQTVPDGLVGGFKELATKTITIPDLDV